MKHPIDNKLPEPIELPLKFREKDGDFEGEVSHPKDILKKFEPVDVLNGHIELVDKSGKVITLHTDDNEVIRQNEYPKNYLGIYYRIADN